MKKNLNEQVYRIKSMMGLIKEQDEIYNNFMKGRVNCRGKKWRGTLGGSSSSGGGGFVGKDNWDGIVNKGAYSDKDKELMIKSFKENFGDIPQELNPNNFNVSSKIEFKNLPKLWVAACREANRYNSAFDKKAKDKYFDENGMIKKEYESIKKSGFNEEKYLIFYRPFFPTENEISPVDILSVYQEKMGGLSNFEPTVKKFYGIKFN